MKHIVTLNFTQSENATLLLFQKGKMLVLFVQICSEQLFITNKGFFFFNAWWNIAQKPKNEDHQVFFFLVNKDHQVAYDISFFHERVACQ